MTKTEASKLYVAIFNRASEQEGNNYWKNKYTSMDTCADDMLATQAAKDYFGNSLDTDQAFIEHIYKNTLNKTATDDPDGIAHWVSQLSDKSRGEVVVDLINAIDSYAPGGIYYNADDATTVAAYNQFSNRVEVSDYFADTVETAPDDWATSTSFGEDLVVTDNSSTVTTAKSAGDSLAADSNTITVETGFTQDWLEGRTLYGVYDWGSEGWVISTIFFNNNGIVESYDSIDGHTTFGYSVLSNGDIYLDEGFTWEIDSINSDYIDVVPGEGEQDYLFFDQSKAEMFFAEIA